MAINLQPIVEQLHDSSHRVVLAITGGGSGIIAELLRVPGASRTVLEAIVPYDFASLVEFLGREPEQACSAETAVAMATRALARARRREVFQTSSEGFAAQTLIRSVEEHGLKPARRADELTPSPPGGEGRGEGCRTAAHEAITPHPNPLPQGEREHESPGRLCESTDRETPPVDKPERLIGLGIAASLASNRPKRGEHRCHIAIARDGSTEVHSITLEKGIRDRAREETLVAEAAVLVLAKACGIAVPELATLLELSERLSHECIPSRSLLSQLLEGTHERLTALPDGQLAASTPIPVGILPGSFHPLHGGHLGLVHAAREMLSGPVSFEISVLNVDKPPLTAAEIRERLRPFIWRNTVELTRAATFLEKSRLLPGVTFVVGADTAERIVAPKYYGNSEPNMLAALAEIAHYNCRFLVAGRINSQGRFQTLTDIAPQFAHLFTPIPESCFRLDVSSTELRRAAGTAPFIRRSKQPRPTRQ